MAREVILLLFSIFYGTEQCENFRYTKDVSAPNAIQIITNVSTDSLDYLRGSCVSDCMSNIDCNAIDVCGTYCRLIRGWDSLYTEQNAATTCQRFQIVRIFYLLTRVGGSCRLYNQMNTCTVYSVQRRGEATRSQRIYFFIYLFFGKFIERIIFFWFLFIASLIPGPISDISKFQRYFRFNIHKIKL